MYNGKFVLRSFLCLVLAGMLIVAMQGMALADSITPGTYSGTLGVGESVTIHKTVTITEAPTSAMVDVLFLFDTTSSMSTLISSAKTNAGTILSNVSGLGNVAFAVANYEDFPQSPYGGSGDTPFTLAQNLTTTSATAQSAINSLSLGNGADGAEANLYALSSAATNVDWRDNSTRIIVWFGDAPGHDGDLEPGYPTDIGLGDTIAALQAENIVVEAVNVSYGVGLNSTGQATAIATATDGHYYPTANASSIVDVIDNAITEVFAEYETVTLDISGVPDGVSVSVTPSDYTGDYDRSIDRTFGFDVTFTGVTAGDYDFNINALVDGGIVASEIDNITVTPIPGALLLFGSGLLGLIGIRRKIQV